MRKVFLDNLPRWEDGRYRGKINWKKSIGLKVKFIYDNIEGKIEIIGYKSTNIIILKYLNNPLFETNTLRFKNCELQGVLKEELLRPVYDKTNPRRVDLRHVPLNSKGIDWNKIVEEKMNISFVYDDIKGIIEIVGYNGRHLRVKYLGNEKIIDRSLFTEGKLGNVLLESINNKDYYITNEFGYVDLRNLPKKYNGIDWFNSINYIVNFKYENIESNFKIINYYNKKHQLKILYNNKEILTQTSTIINIGFSWITGKITNRYLYKINDIINDIQILEYIIINNGKLNLRKGYRYKCLKCGYIGETSESHVKNRKGICPVCCIPCKKVIKGINDIATTHPYLIQYFKNIEDTYKYSYACNKQVLMKCPDCGNIREFPISRLSTQKFSCPKCSDNLSYPNKFIFNILQQLLNDNFKNEKSFKWSNNKRYDFYFKLNNEKYIIEANGMQHYEESGRGRSLEKEQENDKIKKELALQNGIKEENYIIIDCRKSELEFIKNNIANSILNNLFDLSIIDWLKCEEYALNNLCKQICIYWNNKKENETTKHLNIIFKCSREAIIRYLKKGTKLGWCNYNPKEESSKATKKIGFQNGKPIICLNSKEIFNSISKAELKIGSYSNGRISEVCQGKRNSAGKDPITRDKLRWMYYDEYLKLHNQVV